MSNPGVKKDAYGRRIWDKELYRQRAEEELAGPSLRLGKLAPKEVTSLKERPDIELESTTKNGESAFFCETCGVQMTDSQAWLSHINGRNHNRLLGMSLDVERTPAAKVAARILALKRTRSRSPRVQKK